jgi:hypothetical protein
MYEGTESIIRLQKQRSKRLQKLIEANNSHRRNINAVKDQRGKMLKMERSKSKRLQKLIEANNSHRRNINAVKDQRGKMLKME